MFYVLLQQTIHQSGIKVITSPHRAHWLHGWYCITLTHRGGAQLHVFCSSSVNEILAIELYLILIDCISIAEVIQTHEIFLRATHNVCILQVLQYKRSYLEGIALVCNSIVQVVHHYGLFLPGLLQQFHYFMAYHRVHSIERAKHHYIIFPHFWQFHHQALFGIILVEAIFRIIIIIEES